jgi:hypothetical protein
LLRRVFLLLGNCVRQVEMDLNSPGYHGVAFLILESSSALTDAEASDRVYRSY